MLLGGFDNGLTDRQTDKRTDNGGCRVAFATEKKFSFRGVKHNKNEKFIGDLP